jgi:hypothetical protein
MQLSIKQCLFELTPPFPKALENLGFLLVNTVNTLLTTTGLLLSLTKIQD